MTAEQFRQVIDIDLNGPFIVSKAVIPSMIRKGHGKIINICSMMSELGRETVSAYAAAKGGLKMLTKNICSEYGEYNIQCNGIGPGYIATPQTAPLRERQPDGSRHPFDSFIVAKTPAGRWLEAEELAGPAVFLASDASNAVNGHILYVDGGILAYTGKQPTKSIIQNKTPPRSYERGGVLYVKIFKTVLFCISACRLLLFFSRRGRDCRKPDCRAESLPLPPNPRLSRNPNLF